MAVSNVDQLQAEDEQIAKQAKKIEQDLEKAASGKKKTGTTSTVPVDHALTAELESVLLTGLKRYKAGGAVSRWQLLANYVNVKATPPDVAFTPDECLRAAYKLEHGITE